MEQPQRLPTRTLIMGTSLIGLLTLVSYLPALGGGFVWDDDWWVTENSAVQSWGGIRSIWTDTKASQQYYPLTSTSFWLEHQIWGLRPFGYHLTNVLLHGFNAVLLWAILRRLAVPGGWAAAVIFALHPVQVESVAWITERKNLLSGWFYFASLLSYLHFGATRCWRAYVAVLVLFVCALLSKTATCTLPVVIGFLIWWKHGRLGRGDLLGLAPLVVLGLAAGLGTAWLEIHQTGARGEVWDLSVLERVLVAGRALWFYAHKLLWPAHLAFVYPRWAIDSGAAWQYVFPVGAGAVMLGLWVMRGRTGRGGLAAVGVFVVTLAPALGFFNVFFMRYSYVQDHFQYLACAGLITLVTALVTLAGRRVGGLLRSVAICTGLCALAGLVVLTWERGQVFHDSERLWRDSLSKNPEAWLPHNNLGIILAGQGKYPEAIAEYEQALHLRPTYPETYFNLGYALIDMDKFEEGLAALREGLAINPNHPEVYYSIGHHLVRQGRLDEGIESFRQALHIRPLYPKAHLALGDALLASSRYDEAVDHYRTAAARRSPFASDYNNLGNLLVRAGRDAEAETYYREALRRDADYADAHFNLGLMLHTRGDLAGAAGAFQSVLNIDPSHARAAFNLGTVFQQMGNVDGAIAAFEAAIAVDSERADAHYNLGTLLDGRGQIQRAVDHLRRAVEIDPDFADAHHNLAIALFRAGDYAGSWKHVHAARRLGKEMSPRFLEALGTRLPQPAYNSDPNI